MNILFSALQSYLIFIFYALQLMNYLLLSSCIYIVNNNKVLLLLFKSKLTSMWGGYPVASSDGLTNSKGTLTQLGWKTGKPWRAEGRIGTVFLRKPRSTRDCRAIDDDKLIDDRFYTICCKVRSMLLFLDKSTEKVLEEK